MIEVNNYNYKSTLRNASCQFFFFFFFLIGSAIFISVKTKFKILTLVTELYRAQLEVNEEVLINQLGSES